MGLPPLVGHENTLQCLLAAYAQERLPHALLFTGPEGIGKSLAARWLALRLFCKSGAGEACTECESCVQVAAGTHPDYTFVELSPGKNEIGIDAVRSLKRFVALQPVLGGGKLALVDDAERLSLPAQNALLKTLEEPPPRAVLVLIASRPEALISTVRSRCRRVPFRPLRGDEVTAVLRRAGEQEPERLESVLRWAEGSPGRALQFMEFLQGDALSTLRRAVADLDAGRYGSILRVSHGLGKTEQEMRMRLEWLLSHYRDVAAGALTRLSRGDAERDERNDLAVAGALRAGEEILRALQLLRRRNPNRPLLAETLALRLARN